MKVLFTTSDKWISRAIQKATKENVSHSALEFPEVGLVVHSDFLGLRIITSSTFRKTHNIIHEVDIKDIIFCDDKIQDLLGRYEGRPYDFGALAFLGINLFFRNYFNIPMPKSNLWQTTGMFLCVGWDTKVLFDEEDDMITPYQLYIKLKTLLI